MQIVIDIPDAPMKDYQDLYWKIHGMAASEGLFDDKKPSEKAKALGVILKILIGITNGTPLPKGHGRLKDVDSIKTAFPNGEYVRTESVRATIDHEETIIEADTESEGKE